LLEFAALAFNNYSKLSADSDQPTKWNVGGFCAGVGMGSIFLLIPSRVTSECTGWSTT